MFNILLERPPLSITLETGRYIPIYTDFQTWVKVSCIMEDPNIEEEERFVQILSVVLLDPELMEDNTFTADEAKDFMLSILEFYLMDKTKDEIVEDIEHQQQIVPEKIKPKKPVFSFIHDGNYIYSSFVEVYNIDLTTADLHWFEFKVLFMGLPDSCFLKTVIGFRSADTSDKNMDKKYKSYLNKMKNLYALPDMRTEEEKAYDLGNALW